MATARPFAYNTGSTINGTIQIGDLAIGFPDVGFENTGLQWWNGPDEDLGYVIARPDPSGSHIGADGTPAFLGFWRSEEKTDSSFLEFVNFIASGSEVFSDPYDAKIWLESNGYWTSFIGATPTPTNTQTPTNTPTITETPTPTNTQTPTTTTTLTSTPTQTQTPTTTTTLTASQTPTTTTTLTPTPTQTPTTTNTSTPTQTQTPTTTTTLTSTQTPTPTTTPTDPRLAGPDGDGNYYPIVDIGSQTWTSENLRTFSFSDGTPLDNPDGNSVSNATWSAANGSSTRYWTYVNNDPATRTDLYGLLYNQYAVLHGNLCPSGWHVPTATERNTLQTAMGGASVGGRAGKITGSTYWLDAPNDATNSSGFSGVGAGLRVTNGLFSSFKNDGFWWSSTSGSYWWFNCLDPDFYSYNNMDSRRGFSVRCIKD